MSRTSKVLTLVSLGAAALMAIPSRAQGFGASKEKVTLQRRLPALVHLPGNTMRLTVTTADEDGTILYDFQALLETELLKDAPDLREDDNAATRILCQITEYSHPDPIVTEREVPGISLSGISKGGQKLQNLRGSPAS